MSPNLRGILAILGAMAMFVANDSCIKLASVQHPVGQLLFMRGLFSTTFVLALLVALGHLRRGAADSAPIGRRVYLRGAFEAASAVTFISALAVMPLPSVTSIAQASPLLITLFCWFFGLETVGWRRLLAVIVGFAGVVIVLRPGLDGFGIGPLLALACAVFVAARDIVTRSINPATPTSRVTMVATSFAGLGGLVLFPFEIWTWPDTAALGLFALAGLFIAIGNFLIITACRGRDLSVVLPFRYSVILWSLLAGYLLFGDRPDAVGALGIALIVGSGLYSLYRERQHAPAIQLKPPSTSAACDVCKQATG